MACEEFLQQMEDASIAMDEIDAEIAQLENQRTAQEGILIGSYMLYMNCLANQPQGMLRASQTSIVSLTVSSLRKWAKKQMAKIKRKK